MPAAEMLHLLFRQVPMFSCLNHPLLSSLSAPTLRGIFRVLQPRSRQNLTGKWRPSRRNGHLESVTGRLPNTLPDDDVDGKGLLCRDPLRASSVLCLLYAPEPHLHAVLNVDQARE